MQVIIDQFEGDFAIVELPDRTMVNLPRVLIPEATEGDIISIKVEAAATDKRRKKIKGLMNDVWE